IGNRDGKIPRLPVGRLQVVEMEREPPLARRTPAVVLKRELRTEADAAEMVVRRQERLAVDLAVCDLELEAVDLDPRAVIGLEACREIGWRVRPVDPAEGQIIAPVADRGGAQPGLDHA